MTNMTECASEYRGGVEDETQNSSTKKKSRWQRFLDFLKSQKQEFELTDVSIFGELCPHCHCSLYKKNPSGYCDHTDYPKNCYFCTENINTLIKFGKKKNIAGKQNC